ncbi:MAG: GNAT family N-acetyltransferase [Terrimesophilobacter sp.]
MDIRTATPDQWRTIRDLRLRALTDAPDAFCSTLEREQAFDESTWKSRLESAHTVFAWERADAVGTATGKPDPHEGGGREIVGMWVDPAHRGIGLATALIVELMRWARAEGSSSIALWVAEDNEPARRLYEKCGFVATGEREVMRPGVDQVRMRQSLA